MIILILYPTGLTFLNKEADIAIVVEIRGTLAYVINFVLILISALLVPY